MLITYWAKLQSTPFMRSGILRLIRIFVKRSYTHDQPLICAKTAQKEPRYGPDGNFTKIFTYIYHVEILFPKCLIAGIPQWVTKGIKIRQQPVGRTANYINFKCMKDKKKKYELPELDDKVNQLEEPVAGYGLPAFNPFEHAYLSQQGLPMHTLRSISNNLKLTNLQLADIFELSEKTLRNRLKKDDQLKAHETDLALSLLELVTEGLKTFDSKEYFLDWLHTPWEALGQKPYHFIKSVSGVRYLIDELRNIRHGIFA